MNKQDKQFSEMMKDIHIESPSSDFSLKVMSRIQAEAAIQRSPLLLDYQPVISRKTWIILITAFVLLMVYALVSGNESAASNGSGFWSTFSEVMNQLQTTKFSSVWQKGVGIFTAIPTIAYLILTASLALWTLDSLLNRFRHQTSEIQAG